MSRIISNPSSPFFVVDQFISPQMCEDLTSKCTFPPVALHKKSSVESERAEAIVYSRLQPLIPTLEQHFGFNYKSMTRTVVDQYGVGASEAPHAQNSVYVRKKWLRIMPFDFSAVLFLSDYQEQTPLDPAYECYGGKLEFPQWQFGFNPTRGTLVIFPSDPHFINTTTQVQAGALHQVRFDVSADPLWLYDKTKFSGSYASWFNEAS